MSEGNDIARQLENVTHVGGGSGSVSRIVRSTMWRAVPVNRLNYRSASLFFFKSWAFLQSWEFCENFFIGSISWSRRLQRRKPEVNRCIYRLKRSIYFQRRASMPILGNIAAFTVGIPLLNAARLAKIGWGHDFRHASESKLIVWVDRCIDWPLVFSSATAWIKILIL